MKRKEPEYDEEDVDDDEDDYFDEGDDSDVEMYSGSKATSSSKKTSSKSRAREIESDDEEEDEVPCKDFSGPAYVLKPDHESRPLWVTEDHHIFLETHSPYFKQAQDFLIAIAEPLNRPLMIHEYMYSEHSLFAAVSIGLTSDHIISRLNLLSKTQLHPKVVSFIKDCTSNFGKVKLILRKNNFLLEVAEDTFSKVMANAEVADAHIEMSEEDKQMLQSGGKFRMDVRRAEVASEMAAPLDELDLDEDLLGLEEEDALPTRLIAIDPMKVQNVKRSLAEMNHGALEEYDFKNDKDTAALDIDIKPGTVIWQHQEKGLAKMFSHGRARSGMIVLPCGAGKTLVGVTACAHMKRSCVVLCSTGVAVTQWAEQFLLWSTVPQNQIFKFTSESARKIKSAEVPQIGNLLITTYSMISFSKKRNPIAEQIMKQIREREWGLILFDEVHMFPTKNIRNVLNSIHSHCKLGLTATLVREDEKISDLNFLIGPKLYEANWQDLAKEGYLARVQCYQVWCPMTAEFYREYLKEQSGHQKKTLGFFNPNKFFACKKMVEYHEERGDKVIVFSDDLGVLELYSVLLERYHVKGDMSDEDRRAVLEKFKKSSTTNTVCLSSVGDAAIDLPEANVIIQVTGLFGSRRQEAQRMGRILRRKATGASDGRPNAWFYSLVSKDTQEMYFAAKRQQFLVDQGYSFYVLEDYKDQKTGVSVFESHDKATEMKFMTKSQRAKDDRTMKSQDREQGIKPSTRRRMGDMSNLSGADGITYKEVKKNRSKEFRDHRVKGR